jgi:hypothetical protein
MTSIFLHGRGSWAFIGPSERRAVIDKRGELVLLPELRTASIRQSHTGRNKRQTSEALHGPQGGRHPTDALCARVEPQHRVDVQGLAFKTQLAADRTSCRSPATSDGR